MNIVADSIITSAKKPKTAERTMTRVRLFPSGGVEAMNSVVALADMETIDRGIEGPLASIPFAIFYLAGRDERVEARRSECDDRNE
jgi:hypothetical protein